MSIAPEIVENLQELAGLCPKGFALGLHMHFTRAKVVLLTYPQGWLDIYAREGLLPHDPTVRWAVANEGVIDWHDIHTGDPQEDPKQVMARARAYGLCHGFTLSMCRNGSRSLLGTGRPDRPYSTAEKSRIRTLVTALHDATRDCGDMQDSLDRLSVELTRLHADASGVPSPR